MKKTKRREISVIKSGDRWLEITADPILDDEGDFSGSIHIITDITELRNADEEAKKLLSLLNATLESTTDGILVVDGAGKIIYSNSRFSRMWDMPEDVMFRREDEMALDHVLRQLKNPELFLNKVKYLYEHPEEDSFDTIEFKDGKIFERYSQPQRIAGKPVGRVWSFRDVTLSRKAAESLNAGERQYKSLVETTNTGYVVIDMEGRVLDANQEYLRLAGKNELREILGHKVTEWTAKYWNGRNTEAIKKCSADGYIRDFEIDYVDSSGKITPVELNATVVKSDEGPKILTLYRDITERRKSEEALRKHRDHLEEMVGERTASLVESEKKYRELVENTNSIILRMDKTGNVTFFNEFAQSFFGFRPE